MLKNTTVGLDRAWYTWSSRPAEMVFLPLGVRVTPVGFSGHLRRATTFEPGPGVALGAHTTDGAFSDLTLEHGGTTLDWRWRKVDPFRVLGSWTTRATGEWGLRFWINLALSAEGGETVSLVDGAALVKVGTRYLALAANFPAVQVTGHATIDALVQDYETNGYFALATRATSAPVLVLRYNLEMMRDARFAAVVSDDAAAAIREAKALAMAGDAQVAIPLQHQGQHAGSLDAIRDVIAWNTVYDEINARPYTCISRNWNQAKFGGFGVWLDDQFYHALGAGLFDAGLARDNIAVALGNATPQGNLACLVTANDAWIDRTQIPVGAFVTRLLYLRSGDRSLVETAYAALKRNHDWWWATRDPLGSGLFSYGSSDIGEALYVGTPFGARNESSMDNSPIHDEADFDPVTRTLTTQDVGLNSLIAFDAECLAELARIIGRAEESEAIAARGASLRDTIRTQLWDPERKIFANRLRDGRFVKSVGPTSFYPLIAGAADTEQLGHLLTHLADPETFAGAFPLPSVSRDDPAFNDNSYWRGRIWPPLNFLVWHGLRRYGREAEADKLASESVRLFMQSWDPRRLCPENYNADTGEALDQPDTDGFYGWGILMPMMGVAAISDVTPWAGFEIVNGPEDAALTGIATPIGLVDIRRDGGVIHLERAGRALLATNVPGRITQLRLDGDVVSLELPGEIPSGSWIRLTAAEGGRAIVLARFGSDTLIFDADGHATLPAGSAQERRRLIVLVSAPEKDRAH